HAFAADAALAVAITVVVQQETWTSGWVRVSKPALAVAGLAMTLPLVWRRRWPLAVAVTVFAALAVQDAAAGSNAHTPDSQLLAWVVAAYSVAAHSGRTAALAGSAV